MRGSLTPLLFPWLLACAFRVPPPVAGAPDPLPLVAPAEDRERPYALLDDRLWFLDTGASRTTCDDDYVAALGVPVHRTLARSRGEVGTVPLGRAVLRDVTIGGWTFRRLPCAVRDLPSTSSIPTIPRDPVAGVLGANLMRHFAVELDRQAGTVRLLAEPPSDLPRARLRRENLLGARLIAPLSVDGARVDAVVDTGADRTYLHAQTGTELARYDSERQGTGPGGATAVEVVVRGVDHAVVGELTLPLDRYVARKGHPGLLGMDALATPRLVVDMARAHLYRAEGTPPPLPTVSEGRAQASGDDAPL